MVTLTWSKVANASGYHLYLNGKLVATLKPDVNSYSYKSDQATLLSFELEAFNANGGVSNRFRTNVPTCP